LTTPQRNLAERRRRDKFIRRKYGDDGIKTYVVKAEAP
jgi:hypothetical protein